MAKRRVRRSVSEWRRIIDEYRRSGEDDRVSAGAEDCVCGRYAGGRRRFQAEA